MEEVEEEQQAAAGRRGGGRLADTDRNCGDNQVLMYKV
jgi:hypothetical protein